MTIKCRLVEKAKVPGDISYEKGQLHIMLPNGTLFAPGDRWTITGTAPEITLHPSINNYHVSDDPELRARFHKHGYHGWLQNGILTDDLEGRTYP
jgi:hypothetical protein